LVVAKDWYAWVGAAPVVLRGGNDYFGDETLYRRVFSLRPMHSHWEYFSGDVYKGIDEDLFEVGPPSASEYLLASCVAAYVRACGKSPYRNRREALMRGIATGVLSGNEEIGHVTSSAAEQAAFLANDSDYLLSNYLNNIEDVLVELASYWVVCNCGLQGEDVARDILFRADFSDWVESGFGVTRSEMAERHPGGLLEQLASTVRDAAASYCLDHANEIAAAPRPKMYLGRRETIQVMRSYMSSDAGDRPSASSIQEHVRALLTAHPGQDKHQLLASLRRAGLASVTSSELNSVLYAARRMFSHDDSAPPLWSCQ